MLAVLVAAQNAVTNRFSKNNDRGATAVEYGLLVGLMAVAVVAAVLILGPILGDMFESTGSAITDGTTELESEMSGTGGTGTEG